MGYQRAQWRSGLTYRQICDACKTAVIYQDDKLGFRPWYADGFVYCPNCNKPLRHHEEYAIDRPQVQKEMTVTVPSTVEPSAVPAAKPAAPKAKFCYNCGAPLYRGSAFLHGLRYQAYIRMSKKDNCRIGNCPFFLAIFPKISYNKSINR